MALRLDAFNFYEQELKKIPRAGQTEVREGANITLC